MPDRVLIITGAAIIVIVGLLLVVSLWMLRCIKRRSSSLSLSAAGNDSDPNQGDSVATSHCPLPVGQRIESTTSHCCRIFNSFEDAVGELEADEVGAIIVRTRTSGADAENDDHPTILEPVSIESFFPSLFKFPKTGSLPQLSNPNRHIENTTEEENNDDRGMEEPLL